MSVKLLQFLLLTSIINHGRSDQLADLQKKMDHQLELLKNKLTLFETELAQMNKTIGNKTSNNRGSGCGEDWIPYSDTKCYKVLGKKGTEVEAKGNCNQLDKSSTLITIQSKEEQNFLSNRLKDYENISINVWIGLEFVDKAFQWMDGKEYKFENWDENAIRDGNSKCVQMSLADSDLGKWTDDLCQKKYQIICQKKQLSESVISEDVKNLTKVIEQLKQNQTSSFNLINNQQQQIISDHDRINSLETNLEARTKEIDQLKQNPVPIGFIYIQLSGLSEPHNLWPHTEWNNVSPNYAGLFFRAEGGKAGSFGQTQSEQARSLQIYNGLCNDNPNKCSIKDFLYNKNPYTVNTNFYKESFMTGRSDSDTHYGINFRYNTDETRPTNQAIRIWIRIQ